MKSKATKNRMNQRHSTIVNQNKWQATSKTQTQKRLVLFNHTNDYCLQQNMVYKPLIIGTKSTWDLTEIPFPCCDR